MNFFKKNFPLSPQEFASDFLPTKDLDQQSSTVIGNLSSSFTHYQLPINQHVYNRSLLKAKTPLAFLLGIQGTSEKEKLASQMTKKGNISTNQDKSSSDVEHKPCATFNSIQELGLSSTPGYFPFVIRATKKQPFPVLLHQHSHSKHPHFQ